MSTPLATRAFAACDARARAEADDARVLLVFCSYTGFLPGGQHQMAKTYGQASAAALRERQANADPLKWRKHVSYAEFTPPHTPAEGHHIPAPAADLNLVLRC